MSGTSVAVFLALSCMQANAQSQPLEKVLEGKDGKDGFSMTSIWLDEATPGGNAEGYTDTISAPITSTNKSAVRITSTGGRGGRGNWGPQRNIAGADGGHAGALMLTVDAPVSGDLSGRKNLSEMPLIYLHSKGGAGGAGYLTAFAFGDEERYGLWTLFGKSKYPTFDDYLRANASSMTPNGLGAGGKSDAVTFTLKSSVTARGAAAPAIKLVSEGGAAGDDGGTTKYRSQFKAGGAPGKVTATINDSARVVAEGNNSPGIILSSLGGAGGMARGNTSTYYATNGGNGNDVTFTNNGVVETSGVNAAAVILQSIGGAGGRGGGGAFTSAAPGALGGTGGTVQGTNNGTLKTKGDYSFGLLAQSVGGAGGEGARSVLIGSGGKGGATGNAGKVIVTNTGTIQTSGEGASGIVAQSVGGGTAVNALGGQVIAASAASGGKGGLLFFGSGGEGGKGGLGNDVNVENSGTIDVSGKQARGILAQSIGGGGGGGGTATTGGFLFSIALGGRGGEGSSGGNVTVTTKKNGANGKAGSITTKGDGAAGIQALSVGGSGGTGGDATAVTISAVLAFARAVGGDGGIGAKGGRVDVTNNQDITTSGQQSSAISAASIGGGGGDGGQALAVSAAASVKKLPAISIALAVGGSGGKGSSGGDVTVTNTSSLKTEEQASSGIFAMSVGGGGGSAGSAQAHAWTLPVGGLTSVTVASSTGGTGGTGNSGGAVTVTNSGSIFTTGLILDGYSSNGISAYSIGGGGGAGGVAQMRTQEVINTTKASLSYSEGVGGSGGSGNTGGTVKVSNTGILNTMGFDAFGIHAMSVGGGGGAGGITGTYEYGPVAEGALTLVGLANSSQSVGLNPANGGDGGVGGTGGTVNVTNSATIETAGWGATGILAQSIGGGGGTGGGVFLKATRNVTVNEAIGGRGGSGNHGGAVTIFHDANALISTKGAGAHGIHAQSVGGGGGAGGASITSSGGQSASSNQAVTWALKTSMYSLKTWLHEVRDVAKAPWILDQIKSKIPFGKDVIEKMSSSRPNVPVSISINRAVGGSGGGGGDGGRVNITSYGSISTMDDSAHGILAQSIGGGGGSGGKAETSAAQLFSIKSSLGGNGKSGGNGNAVTVSTGRGTIKTQGNSAIGIAAQSIGGGGGSAGLGIDLQAGTLSELIVSGIPTTAITSLLSSYTGGQGGIGGVGGSIKVTHSGTIETQGNQAHGILAQSIGGGGGLTIIDGYDPSVALELNKLLHDTLGANAINVLRENTGLDLSKEIALAKAVENGDMLIKSSRGISVGGAGSGKGDGGEVAVHAGSISTTGLNAFGIVAQSIGGGGGFVSDGVLTGKKVIDTLTGKEVNASGTGVALLGGSGGASGNGGTVKVYLDNGAKLATTGDYASAVFAQSIGGGGGYGGSGISTGQTIAVIGGIGGASGRGGDIHLGSLSQATKFTVSTTGTAAHGFFAQSIGGGGGFAGTFIDPRMNVSVDLIQKAQSALKSLESGKHIKSNDTWITTAIDSNTKVEIEKLKLSTLSDAVLKAAGLDTGSAARSLLAAIARDSDTMSSLQTRLSDLMNNRSRSSGTGGQITINLPTGSNISASGVNAFGIYAQSGYQKLDGSLDSSRKGGNISIHSRGNITGGSGRSAAIGVDGGADNAIHVYSGSVISAGSGNAILSSFGNDNVWNHGTVIGDINLASGETWEANFFENAVSGTYRSKEGAGQILLGSGGRFVNKGTLDIGGVGKIGTLTVSGGSTTLSGTMLVDINALAAAGTRTSDLLKAEKVTLNGVEIAPNVVKGGGLRPEHYVVIQANEITSSSPSSATARYNTAGPISWEVQKTGSQVELRPEAQFSRAADGMALSRTQQSMVNELQSVWDSGNVSASDASTFATMSSISSQEHYRNTLASLSPEGQQQPAAAQTINTRNAITQALSCPIFVSTGTTIDESQCVWARVTGTQISMKENGGSPGFKQHGIGYRVGGQWEIAPDWFLGATAGYQTTSSRTDDRYTASSGHGGDFSVALKRQMGLWYFAAAVNMGYGAYTLDRIFQVGDDAWWAEVDTDVWTGALRTRVAYEFPFENWYVRPYVDVDLIHTYMPGYALTGDGAMLTASAMREWTLAIQPAVEFGARVDLGPSAWLRPFATVGLTYLVGNSLSTEVRFGDEFGNGFDFTSTAEMPDLLFDVGAGLQIFSHDKYELRGEYKAQIGDKFLSQEGMVRAAYRF